MTKISKIKTKHGDIKLPSFMPDATYGAIQSISFNDAKNAGVNEIVTTTLHLEQHLGSEYIEKIGGVHKFFGWNRPILTDSGGFQVFSLIHVGNVKKNKIEDKGCTFKNPTDGRIIKLTPESSQQIQHNLGSDIRTVLDEPTYLDMDQKGLEKAVERTTNWAKRSKNEFMKIYNLTEEQFAQPDKSDRPKLFAVIQGGKNLKLRKRSFEELHNIGFDGYNWGGWTVNKNGTFASEIGEFMAKMIPNNKIKYAMGVGTPDDILISLKQGWNLFDCVLPTRNARHGYLYVNKGVGDKEFKNFSVMHIKSERYKYDTNPIDENCNCETCQTVSRAYLRHLIRIKEPSGFRLATIHNLRFYSDLLEKQYIPLI